MEGTEVRYRVFVSIEIDARSDQEAYEHAMKLGELLKSPFVKMAAQGEGVELSGEAVVHQPKRA